LLAMKDDAVHLMERSACIASKPVPTGFMYKLPMFKPVFMRRARVSPSLFRR
jgi:hypothetical protein